jgi:hypothetical protein
MSMDSALNRLELIHLRTDFLHVIRVSVAFTSLPWTGRTSRRRRGGRSSKSFLPYNSRPPQWAPILDSLRLCDSRHTHRFASDDLSHIFLGTTARESAMPAIVRTMSYMGSGLAHASRSGYTWCIRRTQFRVKFIYPSQTGFVSILSV